MQYLKSTHHIKSENIHVKNISHNTVLISCTHTYTYTKTYTYTYLYTYIYMHKMNHYLHILSLSIFRFKKDWYINFSNHVNIIESVHVIRKINFSLFVKFVSKQCALYLIVFASSNKMFLILNNITGQTYSFINV